VTRPSSLRRTAALALAFAGLSGGLACAPPRPTPPAEAAAPGAPAGDARAGESPSLAATSAARTSPPAPSGAARAGAPTSASPPAPPLPPLSADTPWAELALDGFAPAVVSLPLGARGPTPVMVITHGAGDNPSWQCEWWRTLVRDRAFLLCPRGIPAGRLPSGNMGYAYASEPALEREMLAAIAALGARHGPYVDVERMIYAGFSQGAAFGVPFLARHAGRFRAAILLEGGARADAWTNARAKAMSRDGLGRVLFGCGQAGCAQAARTAAGRLERAGVEARVFHAAGAGHTYAGTGVERETYAAFDWVIDGDPRWAKGPTAPP
jgi:predicted esterase